MTVTIEEARDKRLEAQRQIAEIAQRLMNETGLMVKDVRVNWTTFNYIDQDKPHVANVTAVVQLEGP